MCLRQHLKICSDVSICIYRGMKSIQSRETIGFRQWCSGKFSLVGTLAWQYYGHTPYHYGEGGGGGVGCLNEWFCIKKNPC